MSTGPVKQGTSIYFGTVNDLFYGNILVDPVSAHIKCPWPKDDYVDIMIHKIISVGSRYRRCEPSWSFTYALDCVC